MKTLGWYLLGIGAVIFATDLVVVSSKGGDTSQAVFLGPNGYLSKLQGSFPLPIDLTLIAAGGGLLLL